ncbi:MAG TPA: hypothetical protein VFK05_12855 [Polyangiaceae bacterium]|nr:hypothetical protein [Polyangiaceae bacterium]
MSVTLSEVKRAARAHRAPLAGESAGYLVLAIADQVLQAPRLVQAEEVQLSEDGALRVLAGRASSEEDAELSLRGALDQLLLVASSGSAALTRASRRTAPVGLASLVRELEAALIPVNRSAARRALSRLHRETTRALQSGNLPEDEPPKAAESAAALIAQPLAPAKPAVPATPPTELAGPDSSPAVVEAVESSAAPLIAELCESDAAAEPAVDVEQELETPARASAVQSVPLTAIGQTQLDGVLSALCEELPAPPQFVESDALTSALAVRPVPAPLAAPVMDTAAAEAEPELLLDIDVEFATDEVDSSAAPTVMRAVEVQPVPLAASEADEGEIEGEGGEGEIEIESEGELSCEPPLVDSMLDAPIEARTVPEPVILRKTLRPWLDLLPKPLGAETEPLPQTPTLGTLATELPVLSPEQIAQLSLAASLAPASSPPADAADAHAAAHASEQPEEAREDHTELMPEVEPLAPGVAIVQSKKSDLSELLSTFHVAEPEPGDGRGLSRAIKEMADLDLTPAPFAALIR